MNLIYSGLIESKIEEKSWDKDTVKWVLANEKKVKQIINSVGYKMRHSSLQKGCVEDIYNLVLEYFYKSKDYDLEKANRGDKEVSIDGYVLSCVRGCVLNYMSNEIQNEMKLVYSNKGKDGDELDVLSTIKDSRSEKEYSLIENNLTTTLRAYRYKQYKFGVDMYKVLLIRLLLMALDKSDAEYIQTMEMMDINVQNLKKADRIANREDMMIELVSCVSHMDIWKAIDTLKENVHCGNTIVELISNR